jgi:YD repeat-containing protein
LHFSITASAPRIFTLGGRIRLAYDGANNLIRLTDPLERHFSLAYNDSDYLIQEADPLGNAATYERDAMGNIIRRVDANGQPTAVSLNGLSQVTQADYPDGNPVSYAYDAEGRQIGMTNTHASLLYTYDAAGGRAPGAPPPEWGRGGGDVAE